MTCDQAQELLVDQGGEAPAEVFRHLEECPRCQQRQARRAALWREIEPPGLAPEFARETLAKVKWRLPVSPWWAVPVGALGGLASGLLDLAWQYRLTPDWLDRFTTPLAHLLGVRSAPESDLLVVLPAFLGLLAVLWLARSRNPLYVGALVLALGLGGSLLLGYVDWWSVPDTSLAWRWAAVLPGLAWGLAFLRRTYPDVPRAATSFYLTVGGAAVFYELVLHWDGVRIRLGLPALYYLRFLLPAPELLGWFTLVGLGAALALLAWDRWLLLAPAVLCWALAGAGMAHHGAFRTADQDVWASYPVNRADQTELLLAPGAPPLKAAAPAPAGLSQDGRAFFDLHRLTLSQLRAWDPQPGVAGARQLRARMRPRRLGWWGTGPAMMPSLPVHRDLAPLAAEMGMPDWQRQCQEAVPAGDIRGRLNVAARVRLFQGLTAEQALHEMDREPTYWGWTVLLSTETDAQGNFRFERLPAGRYLVAVLLPGEGWRALDLPGAVEPGTDLGLLRLERK